MNIFKKLFSKKPDSFNKEGVIVEHAFTCGGEDYYEVKNIFALPMQRGMAAVKVYEELKMKCDYDFLKGHVFGVDNIFKGKKIGFEEIAQMKKLNDILKERLFNIAIDLDLVYKLASVTFFDKTESPFEYDPVYAQKKIEHWKKHSNVNDFFLQEPLTRLVPSLKLESVSLQTYLEAIQKVNAIHWETVWEILSSSQKKTLQGSKDFYVGATLPNSEN